MRLRFFLAAVAAAGSVHAADAGAGGGPALGEPMAWRYRLLQTAQAEFDQRVGTLAPGAALGFRLPKVDPAQGGNQVEIVQADQRTTLPMISSAVFVLPQEKDVASSDAMVVVNRRFAKGDFNHPNVQVRSPGLPDGVRRMGDLRLACAAQVAMGKAESLKFRAIFAAVGLFGVDVCEKLEVTNIDAPADAYDTIVIEDGERKLVQPRKQGTPPRLGEEGWSDNARISYLLNDRIVR